MADVKVFYSEDCPQCPPYLDDLKRLSDKFDHTCETLSLQGNPFAVVTVLGRLRDVGHSISSLPFFIVTSDGIQYSYEGILSENTICEVLKKF